MRLAFDASQGIIRCCGCSLDPDLSGHGIVSLEIEFAECPLKDYRTDSLGGLSQANRLFAALKCPSTHVKVTIAVDASHWRIERGIKN